MRKSFRERLKSLRGSRSLKEFAQKVGIPPKTYEHLEYGTRKPTVAAVLSIAEACGVSSDWLLGLPAPDAARPSARGRLGEIIALQQDLLDRLRKLAEEEGDWKQ